ncbi:cation:proton antiporter [Microbacterium sp.]|uniref:cation:proton antiporter n=1 Tax=Microbacterium sp. TaxID=51671 RepID=UPI0039E62E3F
MPDRIAAGERLLVTFETLALILGIGLLGPLLGWSDRWRIPTVVGEIAAGVIVGSTGLRWVDPTEPTFAFLASLGFALVMFVAGSHVPIRDRDLFRGLGVASGRLAIVVVAATILGCAVAWGFGTGHGSLYAVLFASSSAAVILPVVSALTLSGPPVLQLLPQVAIADTLTIIALPLALSPAAAGQATLGTLAVIAASGAVFLVLWQAERRGLRVAVHRKSERRGFALELRISLLLLVLLAALAIWSKVSIMLAGFCLGMVVAAIGEPRRVARQLFGLTEGMFAPIFFVWLGASLDLRDLGAHPGMILLGTVLGAGAMLAHLAARLAGQSMPYALMAAAQLGLPVAAVTLGTHLDVLLPGEASALLLGALITIAVTAAAGRVAARPAHAPGG